MSRKSWLALAVVGAIGISALVVGETLAATVGRSTVDPYTPQASVVATQTAALAARPPVRDPFRPPTRSAFVP